MVTFEIKCWENDWQFVLLTDRIRVLLERCNHSFSNKVLHINNVKKPALVEKHARRLVSQGVLDEYVFVKDYEKDVLEFFDIKKADFKGGYYYSIAELTAIYLCKTEYLLHFSSDAMLNPGKYPWVQSAIDNMADNRKVFVAYPNYHLAKREADYEDANWYYGYGFSDQCYLIRTADFRQRIYQETNPMSERYPKYGGELFEKRVDAYMRNHELLRMSSKHMGYHHKNFPKEVWTRQIELFKQKYLKMFD